MDTARIAETASTTDAAADARAELEPGTQVEVFSSYADAWSRSPFEVVDVTGGACHLRRVSDGATLPQAVTLDRVRPLRMR